MGWAASVGRPLDLKNNGAYSIDFYTNATKYMTILGSGNAGYVGIGTSSPTYKLDVKETANNANATIRAQATGTNGNANLILNKSATADNCMINYKYGSGGGLTDLWATGCRNNDDYSLYNENLGATNFMVQRSTGFVGIGTTTPGYLFEVKASGAKSAAFTGSYLNNTATSSTNYIDKYGTKIESQGSWTGINAVNYALYASASGCSNFNYGVKSDATDGIIAVAFEGNASTGSAGSLVGGWHSNYGAHLSPGGLDYSYNYGCRANVQNGATANGRTKNYGYVAELQYDGATYDALENYGVAIYSYRAQTNYGIYSIAGDDATTTTNTNYGVYSIAGSPNFNCTNAIGVYGKALRGGTVNYGVYGVGGASCTNNTCTNAAGYFSGDVAVSGSLYQSSDAFLKDNVQPILNANNIISQLNPCTYTFRTQDYPSMNLSDALINYGLLADSVVLVLPELVKGFSEIAVKDTNGVIIYPQIDFKAVNYTALIPILIAAVKEQQTQIQALQMAQKPNNPTSNIQKEVTLSDKATVVLEQNNPNPFKDKTSINYNIPSNATSAQILFYNSKGNVINTVDINIKGEGSLLVYGSDLSSGIYTYSLLVDGKVIETRKMIKM